VAEYDVYVLREEFPGLHLRGVSDQPNAFFDTPSGTQVPRRVITAVSRWYEEGTTNLGVMFWTGDRLVEQLRTARQTLAAFLNARSPNEIKFGNNTTTNTFHASRSIAADLRPGDEILVTELDHEANISPWIAIAEDRDLVVRFISINPDDCTLDMRDLENKLSERTKLVAVGYAANSVGTINPIREIARLAHAAGALTWVDAVAYAPHGPIDVQDLDVDFLACSAYKFWGPHLGVLYAREETLGSLRPYKVRPATDPFETGAQNFEGIVGTTAAIDYVASILRDPARTTSDDLTSSDLRASIVASMQAIQAHELRLFTRLIDGLEGMPGVRLFGIVDRNRFDERTPTIALTIEGISPLDAALALKALGIAATQGDFYASPLIDRLGLRASGGVLRFGLGHYTTVEEIDRLLDGVATLTQPTKVQIEA
jgi:cysteine desulfurase family protein (TIGR01976 family)